MRVHGNGTIEQLEKGKPRGRCRKWRLWATTESGRRSKRFAGTYTQAQRALKAFVRELNDMVIGSGSFSSYAESWRSWRAASGNYAPGTLANDKRALQAILRSNLSEMEINEITPDACRDALLYIKTHRVRGSGELSGTTMSKIYTVLNSIMQQAEDDGKVAKNPMSKVKAPKTDTKEKQALSPVEISSVLRNMDGLEIDGRVMALYLIIYLGLRRAEACALYAEDVKNGFIEVRRAVKERDGSIGEPKSKSGMRILPIPSGLCAKLEEWGESRLILGFGDSQTLCCNTQGGVLRPQLLQRWWSGDSKHAGIRDSIGCSGLTLHQLRHSNLSMMARHMSPFDLQRYAGWSSIEPAKVYIHGDLDEVSRAVRSAWGS